MPGFVIIRSSPFVYLKIKGNDLCLRMLLKCLKYFLFIIILIYEVFIRKQENISIGTHQCRITAQSHTPFCHRQTPDGMLPVFIFLIAKPVTLIHNPCIRPDIHAFRQSRNLFLHG